MFGEKIAVERPQDVTARAGPAKAFPWDPVLDGALNLDAPEPYQLLVERLDRIEILDGLHPVTGDVDRVAAIRRRRCREGVGLELGEGDVDCRSIRQRVRESQ